MVLNFFLNPLRTIYSLAYASCMRKKLLTVLSLLILFFFFRTEVSADDHGYSQGMCGSGSICYTGDRGDLTPGKQCGTLSDWHYGVNVNNRSEVPSCWFGFCCDPGPELTATPTLPPGVTPPPPTPPACGTYDNGTCTGVQTALGVISTEPGGLVTSILRLLLSVSGGIATLLIIASGYQLMTSQGNPEKVKEARERLTSAIVGLLFIIFSVAILQIIGVELLKIPGFSQ